MTVLLLKTMHRHTLVLDSDGDLVDLTAEDSYCIGQVSDCLFQELGVGVISNVDVFQGLAGFDGQIMDAADAALAQDAMPGRLTCDEGGRLLEVVDGSELFTGHARTLVGAV